MEWVLILVAVAAAVLLAGGRWRRRRVRSEPAPDHHPSATPAADDARTLDEEPMDRPQPMPPQMLDRSQLLGRDRTFNPRAWDNTPDAPLPGDETTAAPPLIDRDFLRSRQRDDGTAAEDRPV